MHYSFNACIMTAKVAEGGSISGAEYRWSGIACDGRRPVTHGRPFRGVRTDPDDPASMPFVKLAGIYRFGVKT